MAPTIAATSTRNRSFGGCATCRGRHVKCDEKRPTCNVCSNAGIACGGYLKNIFFDFEDGAKQALGRFRRPLLTEAQRERMSQWLTTSITPAKTLRILSQIDEACENTSHDIDFHISRGPFGVFSTGQKEPFTNGALPTQSEDERQAQEPDSFSLSSAAYDLLLGNYGDGTHHQDIEVIPVSHDDLQVAAVPWSTRLMEPIFDTSSQFCFSPSLDFLDMSMDYGRVEESFDDATTVHHLGFPPKTLNDVLLRRPPSPRILPITSIPDVPSENRVPHDAIVLLKHYSTTVIRSLTPFQHVKTPWHVFFLSHAKTCLAALAMDEQVDHATLCAFYATLAISAFSLGSVFESQTWLEQGRTHKQQAREHAREMLKTAYDVPKIAKYKSILVALISMVQVSLLIGERDTTECYLLETEKFVRLKGLDRRKSKKVRLLHHCYVYTRTIHESTYMCGIDSSHRHHVQTAAKSTGVSVCARDCPPFRLMSWNNLREEMLQVKDQEEGENDLHLDRPGLFPATLYPEIYGISEAWVFLLSQVIRLGNEKDAAQQDASADPLTLKDFVRRARALEDCVKGLQRSSEPRGSNDQLVLQDLLDAMKEALVIYFYRRIHDVSATILQPKVLRIRDWLFRYNPTGSTVACGSFGLMWPAFIAACEAEDLDVQTSFSQWFRTHGQLTGFSCFNKTLESVERLWREKRGAHGANVTWLAITRREYIPQSPT